MVPIGEWAILAPKPQPLPESDEPAIKRGAMCQKEVSRLVLGSVGFDTGRVTLYSYARNPRTITICHKPLHSRTGTTSVVCEAYGAGSQKCRTICHYPMLVRSVLEHKRFTE